MSKQYLAILAAVALSAGLASADDGWTFFDGGWRVSGGAVYNSPIRTRLNFNPGHLRPAYSTSGGASKSEAEAEAEAKGTYDARTGKTTYPNGAWFAPDESGDTRYTWNGNIPSGSYSSGDKTFSLGRSYYSGGTEEGYSWSRIAQGYDSDSSGMPGVNIELSRELYRNDQYHFGIDLAFGVAWFIRNDAFRTGYSGYEAGRETSVDKSGYYESTVAAPDRLPDSSDWYWNDNGSYGRGGYDTGFNGGPVFDLNTIKTTGYSTGSGESSTKSCYGAMRVNGDYQQLELMLLARPYYDITEWLRVVGTIGLVVSRDSFNTDVWMTDNGYSYHHNTDHSQWDCYGITGLGAMLRYEDFTLGFDFLARFLARDLDIDDPYVSGDIERSAWMLRVMLGYEF